MKRILSIFAAFFALVSPATAYTAYPTLSASTTYAGLTGSIGYTVLATDGSTVIAARTTTGVVEVGGGVYCVASGITVPDGSAYYVKWDKSGTLVLGGAATVPNSYLGSIKAVTSALQLDGSNYIKSDPQTGVTLQSGQNVATVGGLAPPAHWNNALITTGGVVTANTMQIGGQNVALDGNNLLKVDLEDVHASALSAAIVPANTTQFLGQAVSLDSNNVPKMDSFSWNGSLITTAVPNTGGVTIAAYASNEDPGYLVGKHTVDGSITVNGLFALQLAQILGVAINSFSAPTLTTTYKRQDGTTTALTNSTTVQAGVTPQVLAITRMPGTLPN